MKLNHKNKQNRNTKNGEMGIFILSKKKKMLTRVLINIYVLSIFLIKDLIKIKLLLPLQLLN